MDNYVCRRRFSEVFHLQQLFIGPELSKKWLKRCEELWITCCYLEYCELGFEFEFYYPKRIIIYVVEGLVSFSTSNSYSLVQNWAKSDSRDTKNYELYVII